MNDLSLKYLVLKLADEVDLEKLIQDLITIKAWFDKENHRVTWFGLSTVLLSSDKGECLKKGNITITRLNELIETLTKVIETLIITELKKME